MLHLDASPVYGDLWSGLSLKEYCNWIQEHKQYWGVQESENAQEAQKENQIEEPVQGSLDVYRDFAVLSSPGFNIEERGYVIDMAPKVRNENNFNGENIFLTYFDTG